MPVQAAGLSPPYGFCWPMPACADVPTLDACPSRTPWGDLPCALFETLPCFAA